ncbi:MAG: altronate dehydratase family protein [Propionibacteriaceae bacterium]|jgi:altronate hydrolase|nr:altronate dehydratase family protein [Propionibacteriaceae bacterium]
MTDPATLLLLDGGDDVAVAPRPLAAGQVVALGSDRLAVADDIPAGHKIARRDLEPGAAVHKYGQTIGQAVIPIRAGQHVHSHNLAILDPAPRTATVPALAGRPALPAGGPDSFWGYRRPDGRAATRNYIGLVTSVNCAAGTAKLIARRFEDRLADHPTVDGVVALTHDSGCGWIAGSNGAELFRRTLLGTALHPNFAALVVIGLGCEMLLPGDLLDDLGNRAAACLTIQEQGGVKATVEAGVAAVERLLPLVGQARRQPISCSELVLAVKCGGSDAYSGISANPALGRAADRLVAAGGRVVLGETPELHGAEHLLTGRATSAAAAERLRRRMDWWRDHTAAHQGGLDHNPSPGNKAGGLTTIWEKSLGAVAKAGSSPLVDVVDYAEAVTRPGLTFMDTPGYDPVSVTGLVAGGAHLVAFTTGRGSVFGCRPAPCLKIASNSQIYQRMDGDLDLDAGGVIDGRTSLEAMGETIFQRLVEVASGRQTAAETLGLGGDEFVPWQLGAVV